VILMLMVSLTGCASFSPYQKPNREMTRIEKRVLYSQHEASGRLTFRIGGKIAPAFDWGKIPSYYRDSGSERAAQIHSGYSKYFYSGMIAVIGGVVLLSMSSETGISNSARNSYGLGALGAMIVGGGLDLWGRSRHMWPAQDEFNRYLRTDLEMEEVGEE